MDLILYQWLVDDEQENGTQWNIYNAILFCNSMKWTPQRILPDSSTTGVSFFSAAALRFFK